MHGLGTPEDLELFKNSRCCRELLKKNGIAAP
jgi:hypothetical protein